MNTQNMIDAAMAKPIKFFRHERLDVNMVEVNPPSTGLPGGSGRYRADFYLHGRKISRALAEQHLSRDGGVEMSTHYCPNCGHALPPALISQWHGEASQAKRKTRAGWPKGKPRGAMRPEQPRCQCGLMTLTRAAARKHQCPIDKTS